MKNIMEFLKTSLLGGLFVLLPLLLFYMLFTELLQLVVVLATPIADHLFPKGTFDQVKDPVLLAFVLIVGVSFILGLAVRSMILRRAGLWIEGTTLGRLPLYNAVKNLSKGLMGAKEDEAFRPAVLNSPDGREIVYVIEDHGDGNLTVMLPWAPASFSGSVKILAADRIQMLDATLDEVSRSLSFWGLGTRQLLGRVISPDTNKSDGSNKGFDRKE